VRIVSQSTARYRDTFAHERHQHVFGCHLVRGFEDNPTISGMGSGLTVTLSPTLNAGPFSVRSGIDTW
jgi:hypothetical protein